MTSFSKIRDIFTTTNFKQNGMKQNAIGPWMLYIIWELAKINRTCISKKAHIEDERNFTKKIGRFITSLHGDEVTTAGASIWNVLRLLVTGTV